MLQVLTRKGQLEELYVDNQELEGRRREVEAWLARMEAWQDRMQPVACDLLDTQVREQKVRLQTEQAASLEKGHFESQNLATLDKEIARNVYKLFPPAQEKRLCKGAFVLIELLYYY